MKARSYLEFVKALVEHLNLSRVDYAITGAVAASYYGNPRTTIDADFLIHIPPRQLDRFLRDLEQLEVKIDLGTIHRQVRSGYNIITISDKISPHRADLILTQRIREKRKGRIQGIVTYFQPPESLILAKLRMIKATRPRARSEKDREDIRAILANTKLNKKRIAKESAEQGTLEIYQELVAPRHTR